MKIELSEKQLARILFCLYRTQLSFNNIEPESNIEKPFFTAFSSDLNETAVHIENQVRAKAETREFYE